MGSLFKTPKVAPIKQDPVRIPVPNDIADEEEARRKERERQYAGRMGTVLARRQGGGGTSGTLGG